MAYAKVDKKLNPKKDWQDACLECVDQIYAKMQTNELIKFQLYLLCFEMDKTISLTDREISFEFFNSDHKLTDKNRDFIKRIESQNAIFQDVQAHAKEVKKYIENMFNFIGSFKKIKRCDDWNYMQENISPKVEST